MSTDVMTEKLKNASGLEQHRRVLNTFVIVFLAEDSQFSRARGGVGVNHR